MSVVIDKANDTLEIQFDYSPERMAKIKSLSGYQWNALKRDR